MGIGKWIGGMIGWFAAGPLGALAGFALGSLFDTDNMLEEPEQGWNKTQRKTTDPYNTGERNGFLFSMLVMASYIIKADGSTLR